ncbi:MAG TPA: phenylacetate--CoA ligase family protein, partial [Polyangiaceae bacterium]|nr:phenylacetate--CoA ligase family protein [Polyangiaceae bacterium]
AQGLSAHQHFVQRDLAQLLEQHANGEPERQVLELFERTVRSVPAYAKFLREQGIEPAQIRTLEDLRKLPLTTKANYHHRYPLAERCREGDLSESHMVAASSGSTGEPTFWPRALVDELAVTARFEQVFRDSFAADTRRTLAVVCFPLGTWVGGMFTASCCRHLATKGYPILLVTPGNQKAEIFRVVRALGPLFEQTVLLGYPPFLKDVIDAGLAEGVPWHSYSLKLVLAGEVFSEEWRALVSERAGIRNPVTDFASLYGTADGGVLGNETPLSIVIRRFLAERSDIAQALFGEARLPTLVQYDPWERYFEVHERTLVFSADGGVPHLRYHISDSGGIFAYQALVDRLREFGFDAEQEARKAGATRLHRLPFVYVFGRSHFAVSYYGANVFPDTVSIGLEQPQTRAFVTGKFVLEVKEDEERNRRLTIAVELAPGVTAEPGLDERVAGAILAVLLRLNSEFANYVPAERRQPLVTLWPAGDPEYFPIGVKHRYARK